MTTLARWGLPLLLLLQTAPPRGYGVVLLHDGHRIHGEIEVQDSMIVIHQPYGLNGIHRIPKAECRFWNTEGTEIPEEILADGEWTPEDKARAEYEEEYRRVEEDLDRSIGITRQKMAKDRTQEDKLLQKIVYRNDSLKFKVHPPRSWRKEEDGYLVQFIGPMRVGTPPRIHVVSMPAPKVPFREVVEVYRKSLEKTYGDSAKLWLDFEIVEKTDRKQWALNVTVEKGEAKIKTRRFLVEKEGRVFLLVLYSDDREDERNNEIFRCWRNDFVILR